LSAPAFADGADTPISCIYIEEKKKEKSMLAVLRDDGSLVE
jgi:hypothetical protein